MSQQQVDEFLAATLTRTRPSWPWDSADCTQQVLSRANFHGVLALLQACDLAPDWPQALRDEIREAAIQQAMWEMRHHQILQKALAELDLCGCRPLVLKGTALAYSLYTDPALRSRADTDILFAPKTRPSAHDCLLALGFQLQDAAPSLQSSYAFHAPDGSVHTLDAHWALNNSPLLSRTFDFDELASDAIALPCLAPSARGLSRVASLLFACLHRATHKSNPYQVDGVAHQEANRLIWLFDIHLLSQQLSEDEWIQLLAAARHKGLAELTQEGLMQAHRFFNTTLPGEVMHALGDVHNEPPAKYVHALALRQHWMDWGTLSGPSAKLGWLRDLFFPPAVYMRSRYPQYAGTWLPWLYVRRALTGMVRRLSRHS